MSYEDGNLNFYYYGDSEATAGTGKGAQIFPDILKAARATGQKFEDPFFPANDDSLGALDAVQEIRQAGNDIIWVRPTEVPQALLNGSPPIFQGNLNEFGVNQGKVGDCWFLSVLADATLKPGCFNTIVPADNKTIGFDSGAFHFRLQDVVRVDIVVDDRLPFVIVDGEITETLFCKPTGDGGFWAPLFEKAYAKLYGQYTHIDIGFATDAMLDFTGGYIEEVEPSDSNVIQKIRDLQKADGFLALGTQQDVPDGLQVEVPSNGINPGPEGVSKEGIVGGHEYSFIDIQDVTDRNDPSKVTTLLRLRNPWGNATEWLGDFSDSDPNGAWDKVTPDLRKPKRDDGEFWIPLNSFFRYCDSVDTCRWSDKFRGDENGAISALPGYTFFSLKGNFSAQASGPYNGQNDLRGKGGVYVHLKPNAQGDANNCNFSLTMMYLNYSKAGSNPDIPKFGVYVVWAPGHIKPDSDDFFNNANVTTQTFDEGRRLTNLVYPLEEGTALIVPWLDQPRGDNPPYLLRILTEGDVFTI